MKILLKRYSLIAVFFFVFFSLSSGRLLAEEFLETRGLIHIHKNLGASSLSLDKTLQDAQNKGFEIFFLTDNYDLGMEYGIPPFRNLLKKKIENPTTIKRQGIKYYFDKIERTGEKFPGLILVGGVEIIPFYYWTGSYFDNTLIAHNWEKTFLVFGLDRPEDYMTLPLVQNSHRLRFNPVFLPATLFFIAAILLSFYLIKEKGFFRIIGLLLFLISVLFLINYHPFRPNLFSQYRGDPGMAPYQEVIDDARRKNALIFWAQHTHANADKKAGQISIKDGFGPNDLLLTKNYTGFVIAPDQYDIVEPGNEWDTILNEYCQNHRERPVWQIGAMNFDENTDNIGKIDSISTTFFLKQKNKRFVLDALANGRTYTKIVKKNADLSLNLFSVSDTKNGKYGISGEEILAENPPLVNISISADKGKSNELRVNLIRSGKIISTFKGQPPLNINYQDDYFRKGEKIYYRLIILEENGSRIFTNPVFVDFGTITTNDTIKW